MSLAFRSFCWPTEIEPAPVDRVKWFRDRAERDRLREEIDILNAEFDRTEKSHTRMAEVWTQLANSSSCPGASAYAQRTAHMYSKLARDCLHVYGSTKDRLEKIRGGGGWQIG